MELPARILLRSSIIWNLGAGLFAPIYAIFVERIGGDILAASGAWGAFSIVMGTLILMFGFLEDHRLNRELMVVIGYFLSFAGTAGYIFVSNVAHLFIVQIILGISAAVTVPGWDAIYGMSLKKGREPLEWGVWEGAWRISAGVAAIIGGVVATTFGFRTLFIAMAVLTFTSSLIALRLLKTRI